MEKSCSNTRCLSTAVSMSPNFDPAAKPDGKLIEGGYLALQSESHPIEFRKVELLNLEGCMDRKATNYKSYYVKSAPERCEHEERTDKKE